MQLKCIGFIFLFSSSILLAQNNEYTTQSIADSLKENANAVVRLNQMDITISSQRNMNVKKKRIVTVLNEKGLAKIGAIEYYSTTSSVKKMEAAVLDGFGVEIKKIKRKDFKDQTAVSGSTLFSDDRVIYLDYTPVQYPFTIVYESETESSNTAIIPQWLPLSDYFVSVEKNVLNVNYLENLGFKKKEFNLSKFKVKTTIDTSTQLSYTAVNLIAQKPEDYSPSFKSISPWVMMSLEVFNLEGIDGTAKNWKEYGNWFSQNILKGTDELSTETKEKIKLLVGNVTDPIAKAKIVYKYMQEKTRYISVQVGIGGFKPMLAKDVDRLGYGDCKALSNYTRALLNAVDVPSYYTELYGDADKIDIESDFFSVQGNHAILCVPNNDKYIFLECTSQTNPFGYQANFTDDRNVVVIKPEGGEIIRTKVYQDKDNSQISTGNYTVSATGDFSGEVTIVSEGSQYDQKALVENLEPRDKEAHYKRYWASINNLKIDKTTFSNDKEKVSFGENVAISAVEYGNASGDKMMFVVNGYNRMNGTVKRIRNRKNPFEIERGYHDTDVIAITLPTGFAIEFLPNDFELKGKYGDYKTELVKKDNSNLVYKRSLFLKKGLYTNIEYDEYRLFMEQVSRNDNAKIILTKNQL